MSSLKEFAEQLNSSEQAERIYAAEDIGYLNDSDGVGLLLRRLDRETSRPVRDAIFQALIRMDGEAAVEGVIPLLGNDDCHIRNQAVDLFRKKGEQAIPCLTAAMRAGDKDVRKLVLDVLSGLCVRDTEAIYVAALSDPELNVVITAVENLGRLRAADFRCRIENLLRPEAHPMLIASCIEALVGIGQEASLAAIHECFPTLATLPDFQLSMCLKAFGALGSCREFDAITTLLAVRGSALHPAIIGALLAIYRRLPSMNGSEGLLLQLLEAIESGDAASRYEAVRVLSIWGVRDHVFDRLVSCLHSPDRHDRLAAIEALSCCGRLESEHVLAERAQIETDGEVLEALAC